MRKVVWYPRACAVFGASGASMRDLFKPYYNTGDNITPHKAPLWPVFTTCPIAHKAQKNQEYPRPFFND